MGSLAGLTTYQLPGAVRRPPYGEPGRPKMALKEAEQTQELGRMAAIIEAAENTHAAVASQLTTQIDGLSQRNAEMALKEAEQTQELGRVIAINEACEKAHAAVLAMLCHDLKGAATNSVINGDMLAGLLDEAVWDEGQSAVRDMVNALLIQIRADGTHLQHAVRSIQFITDLTKGVYQPQVSVFDLKQILSQLSARYNAVAVVYMLGDELHDDFFILGNEVS